MMGLAAHLGCCNWVENPMNCAQFCSVAPPATHCTMSARCPLLWLLQVRACTVWAADPYWIRFQVRLQWRAVHAAGTEHCCPLAHLPAQCLTHHPIRALLPRCQPLFAEHCIIPSTPRQCPSTRPVQREAPFRPVLPPVGAPSATNPLFPCAGPGRQAVGGALGPHGVGPLPGSAGARLGERQGTAPIRHPGDHGRAPCLPR